MASTLVLVPPHGAPPDGTPPDGALADGPLTNGAAPAPATVTPARPRMVVRALVRILPFMLAGYALFDRGFAWIHVPGIPLFPGEFTVAVALAVVAAATSTIAPGLRARVTTGILLVFIGWGMVRTVPYVGTYHIDAIRDAALWYYALFGIVVAGLVVSLPHLPKLWAHSYARFLPWLLLWSFAAIQLDQRQGGPYVPDTPVVSWFSHKSGNTAVGAAIALAFLWLVPIEGMRRRTRVLLSVLVSMLVAIGATQSRSGLIAAGVTALVAWLMSQRRRQMVAAMVVPVLLLVGLAWAVDLKVPANPRPVSVTQLAKNLNSLTGGGSAELADTAQWRDELWSSLLNETKRTHKMNTGWGFGRNLADQMGFAGQNPESPLRSPHNSHLDILARMGIVGVCIWAALWVSWFTTMILERRKLDVHGQRFVRGLMGFTIAGVLAILVNAYFDPTLESPQVALWLWSLFGLGLGLVIRERMAREKVTPARVR